jgi:hypothetical protein
VLMVVLVIGVRRWKRRLGPERLGGKLTERHAPRPWESRAVSPREDTLALGGGNVGDGESAHGRIPERTGQDAQR